MLRAVIPDPHRVSEVPKELSDVNVGPSKPVTELLGACLHSLNVSKVACVYSQGWEVQCSPLAEGFLTKAQKHCKNLSVGAELMTSSQHPVRPVQ